ncbi:MAG: type II toxin-antitoxin system RelE/ParE family toxin [Bacteroidota bacterium]
MSQDTPFAISVDTAADKDLVKVHCWYEAESNALAKSFFKHYVQQRNRISEQPFLYARFEGNVRRCALKKFPYHIYYKVLKDQRLIVILAVLHQHQDTSQLAERWK